MFQRVVIIMTLFFSKIFWAAKIMSRSYRVTFEWAQCSQSRIICKESEHRAAELRHAWHSLVLYLTRNVTLVLTYSRSQVCSFPRTSCHCPSCSRSCPSCLPSGFFYNLRVTTREIPFRRSCRTSLISPWDTGNQSRNTPGNAGLTGAPP